MTPGVALVTGASAGIGRAYALELAGRGWSLVVVARDAGRLQALVSEIGGAHHEVLPADLSGQAGCNAVAARLDDDARPVTLLVNAAGLGTAHGFPQASLEEEEAQLDVNVRAVLRLSWAAARAMQRRGDGAIVNIASTAAVWSVGTYAASKTWVVAATDGLAATLRDTPVRVLCVIPGFTRTEFHTRARVDNSGIAAWMWLTPDRVVGDSLAALAAGRARCIPGRRYRVLVALVRLLPAGGRRAVLRRLAPLAPAD